MTTADPTSTPDGAHALICRLLPERLHRLQRASRLPVVFGGVIRWNGDGPRLVINRLSGTHGTSLAGLEVQAGQGLGGRVLRDATPGRVDNYSSTSDITHDFDEIVVAEERLTSVVAAPVVLGGRVHAVLYGASRDQRPPGDHALRSAISVAAQLQRDVVAQLEPTKTAAPTRRPPDPRRALAQLAQLIDETPDPRMRQRLIQIHHDLGGSPAPNTPMPTPSAPSPPMPSPPADLGRLTPRETDVLRLVGVGATNLETAAELGLSPETVKSYLSSAMRKLGSPNRTAAARAALQWGLLE